MFFSVLLGPRTTLKKNACGTSLKRNNSNFNNEKEKQNGEFKQNVLFGYKAAPGVSSDLKIILLRIKQVWWWNIDL